MFSIVQRSSWLSTPATRPSTPRGSARPYPAPCLAGTVLQRRPQGTAAKWPGGGERQWARMEEEEEEPTEQQLLGMVRLLQAEQQRLQAEQQRLQAEQQRLQAEQQRLQAEQQRQAEQLRNLWKQQERLQKQQERSDALIALLLEPLVLDLATQVLWVGGGMHPDNPSSSHNMELDNETHPDSVSSLLSRAKEMLVHVQGSPVAERLQVAVRVLRAAVDNEAQFRQSAKP